MIENKIYYYHCLDCDYIFDDDDIRITRDGDPYGTDTTFFKHCPNCDSTNIKDTE